MRFVNLKIEFSLDELKKLCYAKRRVIYHTNITKLTIWFLHVGLSLPAGFLIFSPCVNNIKDNPYNLLPRKAKNLSGCVLTGRFFVYIKIS